MVAAVLGGVVRGGHDHVVNDDNNVFAGVRPERRNERHAAGRTGGLNIIDLMMTADRRAGGSARQQRRDLGRVTVTLNRTTGAVTVTGIVQRPVGRPRRKRTSTARPRSV